MTSNKDSTYEPHNHRDQRNISTEKINNSVSLKSILQYAVVSVTPFIIMYLVWLHGISTGNTLAIREHDIHIANMKANNIELKELTKSIENELKTLNGILGKLDTRIQIVEGKLK